MHSSSSRSLLPRDSLEHFPCEKEESDRRSCSSFSLSPVPYDFDSPPGFANGAPAYIEDDRTKVEVGEMDEVLPAPSFERTLDEKTPPPSKLRDVQAFLQAFRTTPLSKMGDDLSETLNSACKFSGVGNDLQQIGHEMETEKFTDEHDKEQPKKKKERKKGAAFHPCISQRGSCRYGEHCWLQGLPGDSCIPHTSGVCAYGDVCRNRHAIDGVDIRDLIGTKPRAREVALGGARQVAYVTEPCELGSKIQVATQVVNLKDEEEKEKKNNKDSKFPLSYLPYDNFPPACAKAGKSVLPTPYLDQVRQVQKDSQNGGNDFVNSELGWNTSEKKAMKNMTQCMVAPAWGNTPEALASHVPANSDRSVKNRSDFEGLEDVGFHPCVAQFRKCRFGDNCLFAKVPANYCVRYLNGHCNHASKGCPYLHKIPPGF